MGRGRRRLGPLPAVLTAVLLTLAAAPATAQDGGGGGLPTLGNPTFADHDDTCPTRKQAKGRRKRIAKAQGREVPRGSTVLQRDVLRLTPEQVRRGERLFRSTTAWAQRPSQDPQLRGQVLSCASCHFNGGFTDNTFHLVPTARRAFTFRSTPHLLHVGETPLRFDERADRGGFGWDGRFNCGQASTKSAILAVTEMNAAKEPTQRDLDALTAFMSTLKPEAARPHEDFDPALAAKGEELFNTPKPVVDPGGEFELGQRVSCATCHAGLAGTDDEFHRSLFPRGDPVLDPARVDPDGDDDDPAFTLPPIEYGGSQGEAPGLGEGQAVNVRTPALLGVRFTVPYFHEAVPQCGVGVDTQRLPDPVPDTVARAALLCVTTFYDARFNFGFDAAEQRAIAEYLMSL